MGLLWTSDSTHQRLNKDEKILALAGIFLFEFSLITLQRRLKPLTLIPDIPHR
jgi:hypothetical protein